MSAWFTIKYSQKSLTAPAPPFLELVKLQISLTDGEASAGHPDIPAAFRAGILGCPTDACAEVQK